MLEAEEATSPDGRFIAKLTTSYYQTLHIGEESMSATLVVTERESGDIVIERGFSYDVSRRGAVSGREVTGIAFDGNGNLQVGARDESIETIELPAPGELSAQQVIRRAEAALVAAFPDRAPMLLDEVRPLFWEKGAEDGFCAMCAPRATVGHYVCGDCRDLCTRRVASVTPPVREMALAETIRAVEASAPGAAAVVASLSARAAIAAPRACTVCQLDPPDEPLDIRSPVGRTCAACVRRYART